MPIVNIQSSQAGLTAVLPSVAYIQTTDTLAEVLATGYLNQAVASGLYTFSLPCMCCVSTTPTGTAPYDVNWLQLNYASKNWTLVDPVVKANGTESSNAVSANGSAGVITTSSLTTAGGSSYAITFTNPVINTASVVLVSLMGGTNTTENITLKATAGSGTSTLTIYNNTSATALNGTLLIGYQVL